ncbi:MAG: hypothetical protein R3F56_07750 [Planctomycetota bacterium]
MHLPIRRPVRRARAFALGATCLPLLPLPLLTLAPRAGDGVRRYGAGSPGSGNVEPTLWVSETPRPGNRAFKLRVERSLGGTWAFPFLSQQDADFVYGGVRFLLDTRSAIYYGAFFLPGQGNGGGQGDIPLPLPNNRELIGQPLFLQAFTLDDFAPNPLGFGATAGLQIEVSLSAELLVTRATASRPSPQTAIDLNTRASVDFDAAQIDAGRGVAFVQDGRVALALDAAAGRLRAYDATSFPPVWTGNAALVGDAEPTRIVTTPDNSRAYVLHVGDAGSSPPILAYDVRANASFGQVWPGPAIRLEQVADACAMVFAHDSATAFVLAAGPASGGDARLARVDLRPSSPTFHQSTDELAFAGREAKGLALSPDGATLFVALQTATGTEVAVVDVETFGERDMDPGTPGVQALGAEQSVPRTPLPSQLGRVVADPRGEWLYGATTGGIVRVDVQPTSPTFRRVVRIDDKLASDAVIALALAPAGEKLYAATRDLVVEYDTVTLLATWDWTPSGVVDITVR